MVLRFWQHCVRSGAAHWRVTIFRVNGPRFLEQLTPGSPALWIRRVYRITGPLNVTALRSAWEWVLMRHEILRSPFARLTITRLGPGEHRVALGLHRAVADERSASLVVEELSTGYTGSAAPFKTVQYADYAHWQRGSAELDWWAKELTPLPPPLVLPADRDWSALPGEGSGTLRFDWRLSDLCRAVDATPFDTLLSSYLALLHRYSGAQRVAVGVPLDVRPPSLAGLIGPCENLVLHIGDFDGAPTFRDLVASVRTPAKVDVPYEEVVRALNPDRDAHRIPLCDAVFAYGKERGRLRLSGVDVVEEEVAPATLADLTLTIDRVARTTQGSLCYRTDRFDPATAQVILGHWQTLLKAALSNPDTRVSDLPLEAAPDGPIEVTTPVPPVHELVRKQTGMAFDGLSYAELEERVAALAKTLDVSGRPVAIKMPAGPDYFIASLAVLRAGGHIVWFGMNGSAERERMILEELQPASLEPASSMETEPRVGLGDKAYIAYTSGSTGKPKGVAQTHGALSQFVTWMAAALQIGPGSRVAQWASPEHDPALAEVFATLASGGTLCPVPERIRAHPEKFVQWLEEQEITFLQTVPSFAREILKVILSTGAELVQLERLVLMGEALPGELANGLAKALPQVRLSNIYGPTETIAATWAEIDPPVAGTVPIGRPIPGREVELLDDADRPCPTGITGEIVIRSPYVAAGYGDAQGRYRTGDLGRRRADGLLEFRGRRDLQVKLYGTRIELAEVEAVLNDLESVRECAVVPVSDQDGLVVRLHAYVVGEPDLNAWRAHLRNRLGLVAIDFQPMRDRLPRNVGGKVDRRRLPVPKLARDPLIDGGPETHVEQRLAAIWAELLGHRPLTTEESFFAAGGHSLLVPQLVRLIRDRLGVSLQVRDCFAHSTLAGMSALIVSNGVSSR